MKTKLIAITVPANEVQHLKSLFVNFINEYDNYIADIELYTYKALSYEPNIGLDNGYEILKTIYHKKIAKIYYDELSKKLPTLKLSPNEINNIWLFLSPVLHRIQDCEICKVFFEQIEHKATWKKFNAIRNHKQAHLLSIKVNNLLPQLNSNQDETNHS
jgi:hypothetical protein